MITSVIVGADHVIANLRNMPERASSALYTTMKRLAIALSAHIKRDKLTGQVLKNRTGNLRRSINETVIQESDSMIKGYVGTNAVYAAIHEYGGVTAPHVIMPRNVKALRFIQGGGTVFAKVVNHPGSRMPERSFLRSALTDMQGQITSELSTALRGAIQQ